MALTGSSAAHGFCRAFGIIAAGLIAIVRCPSIGTTNLAIARAELHCERAETEAVVTSRLRSDIRTNK